MSNEGKCARIVGTCFCVFMDIYNKNPLASFGFVGSHTIDKKHKAIENKSKTKRFKVYSQAVANYFGNETFTHFSDPQNSVYLAVSNKNKNVLTMSDNANAILESLI